MYYRVEPQGIGRHPSHSFLGEEPPSPRDFFIPRVQPFDTYHTDNPVKQLDITSTWRGLSSLQAEELCLWEHAFRKCLHEAVRTFVEDTGGGSTELDITLLVANIVSNVAQDGPLEQGIEIYRRLHDFIMLHHCFTAGRHPLSARVDLTHDLMFTWHPPQLDFAEFAISGTENELYYLKPQYIHSVLGLKSDAKFETNCEWLLYTGGCFRGVLPVTDGTQRYLQIKVNATVVTDFGNGVLHEHVSRSCISIDVRKQVTSWRKNSPAFGRIVDGELPVQNSSKVYQTSFPDLTTDTKTDQHDTARVQDAAGSTSSNERELANNHNNPYSPIAGCTDMDHPTLVINQGRSEGLMAMKIKQTMHSVDSHSGKESADESVWLETLRWDFPASPSEERSVGSRRCTRNFGGLSGQSWNSEEEAATTIGQEMGTCVKRVHGVKWASGEDERDVKQMKKDLLMVELRGLEGRMTLGEMKGRWSEETDGLDSIAEAEDDNELGL